MVRRVGVCLEKKFCFQYISLSGMVLSRFFYFTIETFFYLMMTICMRAKCIMCSVTAAIITIYLLCLKVAIQ